MFDFSQISRVGETLETATRDIDSRLESVANLLREQNRLLSFIILLQYSDTTNFKVVLPPEIVSQIEQRLAASNEPLPF